MNPVLVFDKSDRQLYKPRPLVEEIQPRGGQQVGRTVGKLILTESAEKPPIQTAKPHREDFRRNGFLQFFWDTRVATEGTPTWRLL